MKQFKKISPEFPIFQQNKSLKNYDQHHSGSNLHLINFSSNSLNKITRGVFIKQFAQDFILPKKPSNSYPVVGYNHPQLPKVKQKQRQRINGLKYNKISSIIKASRVLDGTKNHQRSFSNMYRDQKQLSVKLPKLDTQVPLNIQKSKILQNPNTMAIAIDETENKKKLSPLNNISNLYNKVIIKTKPGTNGYQIKINQDISIVQINLPYSIKLYSICDGHGINGHYVTKFIKDNLGNNVNFLLKKYFFPPDNISEVFINALAKTNQELLNSDINTEMSGSTVVAIFIYKDTIYSFNIGDSRAILVSQTTDHNWTITPLSIDQKPSRQDQKERILKFGGRISAQKNQKGQDFGPLRVWMKNLQIPGLAMTRSFGDKAGIMAGTTGQPQLITHTITQQDKYMVLASDGVWEYLQNEEVMNIINPFFQKNCLDLAAEKVMRVATDIWQKVSYSRDDITLMIVILSSFRVVYNEEHKQKSYTTVQYEQIN